MSIRRWGRKTKSLAEKGKPGTMARRIEICVEPGTGRKYSWHPTKGFRRYE
jgi:hypothetical protein